MHAIIAVAVIFTAVAGSAISAQESAPTRPLNADEQRARFDEVRSLIRDFESARKEFFAKRDAAIGEAAKETLWQSDENPRPEKWLPRFRAYVDGFAPDPASTIALCWIAFECWGQPHRAALVDIAAGHSTSPYLGNIFTAIPLQPSKEGVDALQLIVANSPKREIRARAEYAYASTLKIILTAYPETERSALTADAIRDMEKSQGKPTAQWVAALDHAATRAEMTATLERVAAEFADVPIVPGAPRTLAECAAADLKALSSLAVGRPAPEIVGKDMADRPMKLSDHRGKVVLLLFWGYFAEPSVSWFSTAKDLEERFGADQFAFVGVNVDKDSKDYAAGAKKKPPFGRSFRDGSNRAISNAWNIQSFPVAYLIDHKGIIAAADAEAGFDDEEITKRVRDLVIAARAEKSKSAPKSPEKMSPEKKK